MEYRTCKVCNGPLFGRSDKLFCKSFCKNFYYNNLRKITLIYAKEHDKILHRNWAILFEIMGEKIKSKKVNRCVLDKKKFNWHYMVSYHISPREQIIHRIYNFTWVIFSDQEVLIKRIL